MLLGCALELRIRRASTRAGALCMGSILTFLVATPLGNGADDRLPASLHVDMLDPDHRLAVAAVAVERVCQCRERAHQPVGELQPHLPSGEAMFAQGGAAEAFHRRLVRRHHCAASIASTTSRAAMPAIAASMALVVEQLGVRVLAAAPPGEPKHLVGEVAAQPRIRAAAQRAACCSSARGWWSRRGW